MQKNQHFSLSFIVLVLNVEPEDATAIHCKVVCLLQSSKFTEAIQFIERTKSNQLTFERAYCEYRLNTPAKALKTIDASNEKPLPPKLKELRAQVLYRLERFEDCFDAYRDIIKNSNDDYEDERAANLSAVAANLAIEGSVSHRHTTITCSLRDLSFISIHTDEGCAQSSRRYV